MKILIVTLVLCVYVSLVVGDVTRIKATKAKVLGRLIKGKHHKRGILSAIPPYKLGHDIPLVTHSVVKPLVVTYPPTATVAAVKVPLSNPLVPHYPVGVGHKVPVSHPHYGLKFPHTKLIVPKPDHHFHHHHHHVAPKPVIPVVPVPPPVPVPVPQPTGAVLHPVPAPSPHVIPAPPAHVHSIQLPPGPVVQSNAFPLAPPPSQILPPSHLHLRPVLPAAAVAFPPTQAFSSPSLSQIPYILRPGGAVQTSLFSTFPRFPLFNYQAPLLPLPSTLSAGQVQQVLVERPQVPQYHYIPQASVHGGILEQHTPNVALDQTPTFLHPSNIVPPSVIPLNPPHELPQPAVHLHPTQAEYPQHEIPLHPTQAVYPQHDIPLHPTQAAYPQHEIPLHPTQAVYPQHEIPLHPTQAAIPQPAIHLQPTQPSVHLDHDGWSPVQSQPHDVPSVQIPETQVPQQGHQFTQEQGTQVYEQHTGDQYDFQQQLQHHIQQQIEQAQYEQHLNNQHQLGQEYGVPQQIGQEYGQPNDYFQHNQDFANQHGQDFSQQGQDFSQQGQNFAQQGQNFAQQGQNFAPQGPDFIQHGQNFPPNDYNIAQPGQEYGVPQQGVEGRSGDQGDQVDQGQQQFHNHIPLGLQPPIDRPLEHFR